MMCSHGSARASRCLSLGISRGTTRLFWNQSHDIVEHAGRRVMPPVQFPMMSLHASNISRHRRRMSSTPFYGTPPPPSSRYNSSQDAKNAPSPNSAQRQQQQLGDARQRQRQHEQQHHNLPPLTPMQRLVTLVHSSLTALNDPTRADAVAAVGEVTGSYALSKMMAGMESDAIGRRILKERPIVDESVALRAMDLLRRRDDKMSGSNVNLRNPINGGRERGMAFGEAYATFLKTHEFDPNERSSVRFISDPNLSYVMTRYRQCHDYWHVLTGLPPTVLGELALKWLELMQTGLPLAALSATGGALGASGLSSRERDVLWKVYLPWAVRVGGNMRAHSLMCVYYEEELETDLSALRRRMGIEAAPPVEL